jgi:hypothetical protein
VPGRAADPAEFLHSVNIQGLTNSLLGLGSVFLSLKFKTVYAVIPFLIILLSRRIWGRPLLKRLQSEIGQEKSHGT